MLGGEVDDRRSAICAAVIAAGRDAMASHRSAAFAVGYPADRSDDAIDVLAPPPHRRAPMSPAPSRAPAPMT